MHALSQVSAEMLAAMQAKIRAPFDAQSHSLYSTARLWDDGIIEPADTRRVLGLGLAMASNAPVDPTTFGVFRM